MTMNEIFRKATEILLAEYSQGFVVSERHVQAVFYREMCGLLDRANNNVKVLVEPKIQTSPESAVSGKIPDMLIVEGNEVTGVLEIKYVPHGKIEYQKDLETFHAFDALRGDPNVKAHLKVVPETGQWDVANTFSISKALQFHYLAIGNHWSHLFTNTLNLVDDALPKRPMFSFYTYFILVGNGPRAPRFGCY